MSIRDEWGCFKRRQLPHLDKPGVPTFVTFRLANSLPNSVMENLAVRAREWEKELSNDPESQTTVTKRRFAFVDKYLDSHCATGSGPLHLANPRFAKVVASHLEWGVINKRYLLHAWCIMPNHVHMLIETLPKEFVFENYEVSWAGVVARAETLGPERFRARFLHSQSSDDRQECLSHEYWPLSQLLKGIKGTSAREINRMRKVTGRFWQDESFDHVVRNESEYERVLDYIRKNPLIAGLDNGTGSHQFTAVNSIRAAKVASFDA